MSNYELGKFGFHKNDLRTNFDFLFSPEAAEIRTTLKRIENKYPAHSVSKEILNSAKRISKDPKEVLSIVESFAYLYDRLFNEGFTSYSGNSKEGHESITFFSPYLPNCVKYKEQDPKKDVIYSEKLIQALGMVKDSRLDLTLLSQKKYDEYISKKSAEKTLINSKRMPKEKYIGQLPLGLVTTREIKYYSQSDYESDKNWYDGFDWDDWQSEMAGRVWTEIVHASPTMPNKSDIGKITSDNQKTEWVYGLLSSPIGHKSQ
ncbi:MAG: hypothetical protein UT39_C0023G0004 [Candidatus Woesebacteria bacterium GW2011_GWA1_39_21]|uniref:Uncharacterized protein n=1 Tax=Candidatus Woesebacteria bacterium GW2011_GWA1_39_21 TaxID=1618550 RepID=A0A0G0N410_9BACT|nr:MAG: hypothetical protein UT39_C0023G0004 [Candidatus Woesebacteria bacterium GW2011_GWA1_39_21]